MSNQRSVCPRCNHRNLPDSKYCENCGLDLGLLTAGNAQEASSLPMAASGRQIITEDNSQRQQATGDTVIQQQTSTGGTNLACMGTTAVVVVALVFLLIILVALV